MKEALNFSTNSWSYFIVAILTILTFGGTSRAQWTRVAMNDTTEYAQIIFVDSLRGYMAATAGYNYNSLGIVYVTSDGGKSWNGIKVSGSIGLSSVSAIGDSLVWVCGGAKVYYSHNGANTWFFDTVAINGTPVFVKTIQFVDSVNGWITGDYLLASTGIFHSSDAGMSWKPQYTYSAPYYTYLGKGIFTDRLHGWVSDRFVVHYTTDGGSTWNAQGIGGSTISSVFFLDTLHGWAVGDQGFIGKTVDGGKDWSGSYVGPYLRQYTSVFFTDTLNGWVASNGGGIIHTTDGGSTWIIQRSDTSGYPAINSLYFINKNEGWAVGNGTVLHTTNGGVTAIEEPSLHPTAFRLFQNYPNPFNPSTAISYQLSAVSQVSLKVFNVLGRQVAALVNGVENAGIHTITWNAAKFASGVYFYRLTTSSQYGTFEETKQMILIK